MVPDIPRLRQICQPESVIGKDPFYFRYIIRPFSIYITRVFLHTRITANQVTVLHCILGTIGGVLFLSGEYIHSLLGVIFIQLHVVFDNVDGEVARYRGLINSPIGPFTDRVAHNIVFPAIFIGLTFGLYNRYPDNKLILPLGFLASTAYLFIFNYQAIWYLSVSESMKADADGFIRLRILNYRDYKKEFMGKGRSRFKDIIVQAITSAIFFRFREILAVFVILRLELYLLILYGCILPFVPVVAYFKDWGRETKLIKRGTI